MTSLEFKRGGFYTEGDRTTNIFKDPQFALQNLLSCLFHSTQQEHLVDLALNLLQYVKENRGIQTNDFWKKGDQNPKEIGGMTYSFSNYQTLIRHLRQAGMLQGKKGGLLQLSNKFTYYLDLASDCWRAFYRS